MHTLIRQKLKEIETEYDVIILYACESGSRAWGFPSADSDFDVRFIYLHRPEWYLSINLEHKRDVIERPIHDRLDISGWDLRKALKLLRKSNPPLLEWLGSPIVYHELPGVVEAMRRLAAEHYSSKACMYHYLHMARGNFREFLRGEQIRVKKYFYVLLPLLAIRWLEADLGVVPTEFHALVDGVIDSAALKSAIDDLLAAKARGAELDYGPRIPLISDFIEAEIERLDGKHFSDRSAQFPLEPLNTLFRQALQSVWK